jgi:hypothetical protein
MAQTRKNKEYEVAFAVGTSNEVRYPIEATSKRAAALEFSRQYLGRADSTLADIVRVNQVKRDEEGQQI